jgi:hypothetical protein
LLLRERDKGVFYRFVIPRSPIVLGILIVFAIGSSGRRVNGSSKPNSRACRALGHESSEKVTVWHNLYSVRRVYNGRRCDPGKVPVTKIFQEK